MRRSRKKMKNPAKPMLADMLRKFEVGDKVHVIIRSNRRFQHPRFHGKTGTVLAKSGRTYIVEVRDGSLAKKLFLAPEHLKKG